MTLSTDCDSLIFVSVIELLNQSISIIIHSEHTSSANSAALIHAVIAPENKKRSHIITAKDNQNMIYISDFVEINVIRKSHTDTVIHFTTPVGSFTRTRNFSERGMHAVSRLYLFTVNK